MPTTSLLYTFFVLGLILGGVLSYRLLVRSRRVITASNVLYQWPGGRLPAWKYEPHTFTAILVHTLAVSILGIAALFAARKPPSFIYPLLEGDSSMIALLWFVEAGSLAVTGYLLGALLAFPIARLDKKPIAYGVSELGIAHGRILLPWRGFSHFVLDPAPRMLRFYSAYAPDLPNFTLVLPETLPLEEQVAFLESHLPRSAPATTGLRRHTRRSYVPAMLLLSILFVSLGWLATLLERELALFVIALCTALLATLGGQLISLYGYGGRKATMSG